MLDTPYYLSWNTHINNTTSNANKTLVFVKRNVITKNKDTKTMACNTLVRPQVEYASSVWSPYTKENINKIDKVQRRATRWASNDYSTYSSVTDMLSNLGWRSIEKKTVSKRTSQIYILSRYTFPTILALFINAGPSTRTQSVTYSVIFWVCPNRRPQTNPRHREEKSQKTDRLNTTKVKYTQLSFLLY